jgi:hypothetical protein
MYGTDGTVFEASGSEDEPDFLEVLGENGPYLGAVYALNALVVFAFLDHGALMDGRLTYRPLVESVGGLTELLAGSFAVMFLATTAVGVGYALSVVTEHDHLDRYALEERISVVSVVPALQLFAIVLCPLVTNLSIVAGAEFVITTVF